MYNGATLLPLSCATPDAFSLMSRGDVFLDPTILELFLSSGIGAGFCDFVLVARSLVFSVFKFSYPLIYTPSALFVVKAAYAAYSPSQATGYLFGPTNAPLVRLTPNSPTCFLSYT